MAVTTCDMFLGLGRRDEPSQEPWIGSVAEACDPAALALLALRRPADSASITAMTACAFRLITNPQPGAPQAFLQAEGIRGSTA
ncbi:MAG: hypothetical protein WAN93_07080 [Solirubrobacteraceae bacterium]